MIRKETRVSHGRMRHVLPWLALSVLIILLLQAGVTHVAAHALLTRSVPEANAELQQPPPAIEMWFSEALEPSFSKARILNSQGEEIETETVTFDPDDPTHMTLPLEQLEPGIYTVAWQTLSKIDGHEWYGSFPFTVLNPDGSRPTGSAAQANLGSRGELPSPSEALSRWLILLGGMMFFGAAVLRITIISVGETDEKRRTKLSAVQDTVLWIVYASFAFLAVGGVLQIVLQALRLGDVAALPRLLLDTRTGTLVLVRQSLAFAGLLVAITLPQPPQIERYGRFLIAVGIGGSVVSLALLLLGAFNGSELLVGSTTIGIVMAGLVSAWWPARRRWQNAEQWSWRALVLLAAAVLLSVSINSHAGAVPGSIWAILGDYVHLLAAGVWIGGLILLPLLLWTLRRSPETPIPESRAPALLTRFSYVASFSVFVLVLTGIFNSLVEIPTPESLWNTTYGHVLLLKVGLVTITLAVAFLNNRRIHGQAQMLQHPGELQHVSRTVALETALALVLMFSVAVLVQTPVPRGLPEVQTAFQLKLPFNTIVPADDLYIHVQVTPNEVGNNRFWVHLYHADGSDIGEVQLVRLFIEYQDSQLGRSTADLQPLRDDIFGIEGAWLNQAGNWQISIYVRRRGMDDVLADVALDVPRPEGQVVSASPWESPVPGVPLGLLLGSALLALALVPLIWREPLRRWQPVGRRAMLGATAFLALAGVILIGLSAPDLLAADATKPIPASPESVAQGEEVYQENCASCHGPEGLGDGPQGAGLVPPPANLEIHVPLHDNVELYGYIRDGIPGTGMPAWKGQLEPEEMWHLVNYLRAQFGSKR